MLVVFVCLRALCNQQRSSQYEPHIMQKTIATNPKPHYTPLHPVSDGFGCECGIKATWPEVLQTFWHRLSFVLVLCLVNIHCRLR